MSYGYFITYNVVGGILWVAIFTVAGYFFGNIPFVQENFELVIIAIIVISVIPAVYEAWKAHQESKAGKKEDDEDSKIKGPRVRGFVGSRRSSRALAPSTFVRLVFYHCAPLCSRRQFSPLLSIRIAPLNRSRTEPDHQRYVCFRSSCFSPDQKMSDGQAATVIILGTGNGGPAKETIFT